jgi:hypothetical protein
MIDQPLLLVLSSGMAAFLSLSMWDPDEMVVSSHLGRRWLRWLAVVGYALTAMLTIGLTVASESRAVAVPLSPPFKNLGLAIVDDGVLWSDEGTVFLEGPRWGIRPLGASKDASSWSASATAVALGPGFASVLPRRLSAAAGPPRLSGGGCTWWKPAGPFVVVQDEVVAGAECQEVTEHPVREPLYIRNLRGGGWKVLRWLAGASRPALAAEGPLLAIGDQRSDRRMKVSILDLDTGEMQASFETPLGKLAFASPRRLVLEIPVRDAERRPRVSLRLYSTGGHHFGNLGAVTEPLISGTHIVAYENGTLTVRSFAGGAPRRVIGFNAPARELEAFAFRWPELVVSETTSNPLLPSEVSCFSDSYGPSSKPFLASFDLARSKPFDAPPATVKVEPAVPLNCLREGAVPP